MAKRFQGTPDRGVLEQEPEGSGGTGTTVSVDNFPSTFPDPNSPDLSGVWSYIGDNGAGAGTANVPAGSRVLAAACWTENATTPRYRVNGGDWVSLPTSGDGSIDVLANLPGPVAIEFQGTGGFVVTYLT